MTCSCPSAKRHAKACIFVLLSVPALFLMGFDSTKKPSGRAKPAFITASVLPRTARRLMASAACFQSVFVQAPCSICVSVRCCFSSVSSFSGCRVPQGRFITEAGCKHGKVPACPFLVRWWLRYGKVKRKKNSSHLAFQDEWHSLLWLAVSSIDFRSVEVSPVALEKQTHAVLMQTFPSSWSL